MGVTFIILIIFYQSLLFFKLIECRFQCKYIKDKYHECSSFNLALRLFSWKFDYTCIWRDIDVIEILLAYGVRNVRMIQVCRIIIFHM